MKLVKFPVTFLFSALLITLSVSLMASDQQLTILKFILSEVEVCDAKDNCEDISRKKLPNPSKSPIPILEANPKTGMLMFKVGNKEYWVHQTEVKLNKKYTVSQTCEYTAKSNDNVVATMGAGECK